MLQFEVTGRRRGAFTIRDKEGILAKVTYPKGWRWLPEITLGRDIVYRENVYTVKTIKGKNADNVFLNGQVAYSVTRNWKGHNTITPAVNPANSFVIKLSGFFLTNYFELLDYRHARLATVKYTFSWKKFRMYYRLEADPYLAETEQGRLSLALLLHYYRDLLATSGQV